MPAEQRERFNVGFGISDPMANQFIVFNGDVNMTGNDTIWNETADAWDNSEYESSESTSSTESTTTESSSEGGRRRLSTDFNMTTYENDIKRISRYL